MACAHARTLPELFGKPDDDALRAADVTETVHVLILSDFADEFGGGRAGKCLAVRAFLC